jgi:serine/threonine-protein kinase
VLPAELASGEARERFLREARTAAKLSHPHIVPLHTFSESGALLYYVMGFVEGESLEMRLRREGRLTVDEVRRIVSELADALAYAHQMGVVHRDVKPDNVLIDRHTGRAMLTDFGIAKQHAGAETLTGTGIVVGTPHYMSPEQASGERALDGRSDVYSLGVMAYRMLSGRLPFEGDRLQDVLAQHVTRAPVPIAQAMPSLPPDLVNLVSRALAKQPAERPNAESIRAALQEDTDDSLPDDLQSISGMGVRTLLVSVGVVEATVLGALFMPNFNSVVAGTMLTLAALAPVVSGLAVVRKIRRYGGRTVAHALFLQPAWWRSRWPRFGRRAGDVWDRLPREVRSARATNALEWVVLTSLVAADIALYWIRENVRAPDPTQGLHDVPGLLALSAACLVGAIVPFVSYRRWAAQHGLSTHEGHRLLREPTFARAFWARPSVAALLEPASRAETHGRLADRSPGALLREIEGLARDESSSPHADCYREALAAARGLVAAIAACDAEVAQLTRDADPQEHARIRASLDALGPPDATSGSPKERMRELLTKQLELFRELERQRETVASRRARLVEQLRTVALHLANLRAAVADSSDASELTGRVRALLESLDYRLAGVKSAEELGRH